MSLTFHTVLEVKLFDSLEKAFEVLHENEPMLVKANSRKICIVRRKGKIIAFQNECPHLGESLHAGKINYLGEIVCPLHSYRFSLETGEPTSQSCRSLKFIPIIIDESVYLAM